MHLSSHPLITYLQSLDVSRDDFAIFGSGPMFAVGIRPIDELDDIDIIANEKAWVQFQNYGDVVVDETKDWGQEKIYLQDGQIEIFNDWGPSAYDVNDLINNSMVVDNLRFIQLETVIVWKKEMGREKDLRHIEMIQKYLQQHAN